LDYPETDDEEDPVGLIDWVRQEWLVDGLRQEQLLFDWVCDALAVRVKSGSSLTGCAKYWLCAPRTARRHHLCCARALPQPSLLCMSTPLWLMHAQAPFWPRQRKGRLRRIMGKAREMPWQVLCAPSQPWPSERAMDA